MDTTEKRETLKLDVGLTKEEASKYAGIAAFGLAPSAAAALAIAGPSVFKVDVFELLRPEKPEGYEMRRVTGGERALAAIDFMNKVERIMDSATDKAEMDRWIREAYGNSPEAAFEMYHNLRALKLYMEMVLSGLAGGYMNRRDFLVRGKIATDIAAWETGITDEMLATRDAITEAERGKGSGH